MANARNYKRKNIAVWGIVLGEDFAVSENDAQVINYSAKSGIIRIAKKDISYDTLAEETSYWNNFNQESGESKE